MYLHLKFSCCQKLLPKPSIFKIPEGNLFMDLKLYAVFFGLLLLSKCILTEIRPSHTEVSQSLTETSNATQSEDKIVLTKISNAKIYLSKNNIQDSRESSDIQIPYSSSKVFLTDTNRTLDISSSHRNLNFSSYSVESFSANVSSENLTFRDTESQSTQIHNTGKRQIRDVVSSISKTHSGNESLLSRLISASSSQINPIFYSLNNKNFGITVPATANLTSEYNGNHSILIGNSSNTEILDVRAGITSSGIQTTYSDSKILFTKAIEQKDVFSSYASLDFSSHDHQYFDTTFPINENIATNAIQTETLRDNLLSTDSDRHKVTSSSHTNEKISSLQHETFAITSSIHNDLTPNKTTHNSQIYITSETQRLNVIPNFRSSGIETMNANNKPLLSDTDVLVHVSSSHNNLNSYFRDDESFRTTISKIENITSTEIANQTTQTHIFMENQRPTFETGITNKDDWMQTRSDNLLLPETGGPINISSFHMNMSFIPPNDETLEIFVTRDKELTSWDKAAHSNYVETRTLDVISDTPNISIQTAYTGNKVFFTNASKSTNMSSSPTNLSSTPIAEISANFVTNDEYMNLKDNATHPTEIHLNGNTQTQDVTSNTRNSSIQTTYTSSKPFLAEISVLRNVSSSFLTFNSSSPGDDTFVIGVSMGEDSTPKDLATYSTQLNTSSQTERVHGMPDETYSKQMDEILGTENTHLSDTSDFPIQIFNANVSFRDDNSFQIIDKIMNENSTSADISTQISKVDILRENQKPPTTNITTNEIQTETLSSKFLLTKVNRSMSVSISHDDEFFGSPATVNENLTSAETLTNFTQTYIDVENLKQSTPSDIKIKDNWTQILSDNSLPVETNRLMYVSRSRTNLSFFPPDPDSFAASVPKDEDLNFRDAYSIPIDLSNETQRQDIISHNHSSVNQTADTSNQVFYPDTKGTTGVLSFHNNLSSFREDGSFRTDLIKNNLTPADIGNQSTQIYIFGENRKSSVAFRIPITDNWTDSQMGTILVTEADKPNSVRNSNTNLSVSFNANESILSLVTKRKTSNEHYLKNKSSIPKFSKNISFELSRNGSRNLTTIIDHVNTQQKEVHSDFMLQGSSGDSRKISELPDKIFVKTSTEVIDINMKSNSNLSTFPVSIHSALTGAYRLIGGRLESEPWPWMVAIYAASDMTFFCAGSLIEKTYVVSAAHCFIGQNGLKLVVSVGKLKKISKPSNGIAVKEVIIHQGFEKSCYCNDIAILHLAEPSDSTTIGISEFDTAVVGETVTLLGWGDTKFQGKNRHSGTNRLQIISHLPIHSSKECRMILSKILHKDLPEEFERQTICAGNQYGTMDACAGDSGGPLMHQSYDGRWNLIGIVSFGYKCGQPSVYGSYTRVSHYASWIWNTIDSLE